jgi:hypothetical protein
MTSKKQLRALPLFVACTALVASAAGANGGMFFDVDTRPPVLRYVGQVKDTRGKPVDKLVVAITVKNIELTFPFRNDALGHFKSPDIGRAIIGLGKKIDRSQIELKVVKRGYRTVSIRQSPLGTTVDVTVIVEPL